MKFTYLTQNDFERNCPCWSQLAAYAESIFPATSRLDLKIARQSMSDSNTYTAIYDVASGLAKFILEVSCTIHSDHTYSYKTINKTETP